MALSLDKIGSEAPGLLSLAKQASEAIDLSGLNGQTAKVALVLDYSGSMSRTYRSGAMQRLAEKVLALATQFDDDGNIDFFVFDRHAAYLGEISLQDFAGSVDRLTKGRHMGTTNYAEAFLAVRDHFAPAKKGFFSSLRKAAAGPADQPVYALFLTDGGPDSRTAAKEALIEVSRSPIFWKFLSIGSESMSFLEKLDSEVKGRLIDNANYQPIGDVDKISDAELFAKMLEEFPDWLKEARAQGLIK